MQRVGNLMHEITGVMRLTRNILDLCMATGGYSASVLKFNPQAFVSGATLLEEHGGHQLFVREDLYEFGKGISLRLRKTWVSVMAMSQKDIWILDIFKKMRSGQERDLSLCSATAKCFETNLIITKSGRQMWAGTLGDTLKCREEPVERERCNLIFTRETVTRNSV